MSDTLIVGTQSGEENVYPSFAQALRQSRPGQVIYVRGPICEEVRFNEANSGLADAPIVVMPYPGEIGHIDGEYLIPDEGPDTGWTAPDGTRGFHTPLVGINANHVTWSVNVLSSQGRGIQLGRSGERKRGLAITDCLIDGARTCPIDIRNVDGVSLTNVDVRDGSNFNRAKGQGNTNWSGAIKTIDAWNVVLDKVNVWNHWGNVITPSRLSKNITVRNCNVWDCAGAAYYGHYVEGLVIDNCVAFYTPSWDLPVSGGFVFNNEEEFTQEGSKPGQIKVRNSAAIGCKFGFAIGGNEGAAGVTVRTQGLLMEYNLSINSEQAAIRLNPNAQVKDGIFQFNRFVGGKQMIQGEPSPYYWAHNYWSGNVPEVAAGYRIPEFPEFARRPDSVGQARDWAADIMAWMQPADPPPTQPKRYSLDEQTHDLLKRTYAMLGDVIEQIAE